MATFSNILDSAYRDAYRPGTPNESDCSGFVITAAAKLGLQLPNLQADRLLDHLKANWELLGTGAPGLQAAREAVARRRFVVVGASSAELNDTNGHVAVLLDRSRNGFPLVYGGGSAAARTQGEKALNYVFARQYHPVLRYYAPRSTLVPPFDDKSAIRTLGSAQRDELLSGIANPEFVQLASPLRLCRFTDSGHGPNEGLVSPWWIAEADFLKIIAARDRSRAAHNNDASRALSLGFLARWAVAIPQEWQRDGKGKPTAMNLLLRADLKGSLDAFVGRAREQRETSPNGITLKWSGWPSVTQYYIPAFSRKAPVNASLADVLKLLSVGAPTYIKSTPLYEREK